MTIEYGLTSSGFTPKTFDVIRTEMGDALRAAFGLSLDLGDRSIFGQIVAIFAERVALVWQLAEQVYSSQDPDKAAGAALDALCLLTGTFRPAARSSTTTLTLTGVPTTVVSSGSKASAPSSGTQFAINTGVTGTIALLPSWTTLHFYNVGDRVTSSGNAYVCTVAGGSAVSGPGPTSAVQNTLVTDNAITWRVMGVGTGAVDVAATATATGALVATSGDCTRIDTAVSGWNGVINLADAVVGSPIATDETLRLLREAELAAAGKSTALAIRAALLLLSDTIPGAVTVFENDTDVTDANGLPPHSVECLVRGYAQDSVADKAVAACLLAEVAAGVVTYGSTSVSVTDSQNIAHVIRFSRPTVVPIYVTVTLTEDAANYPSDGDAQVAAAIVAWGNALSTGRDAVASAISAQAFKVPGVLDASVKIGTVPTPTTAITIPISVRQLAVYDSSRITVNSMVGTP